MGKCPMLRNVINGKATIQENTKKLLVATKEFKRKNKSKKENILLKKTMEEKMRKEEKEMAKLQRIPTLAPIMNQMAEMTMKRGHMMIKQEISKEQLFHKGVLEEMVCELLFEIYVYEKTLRNIYEIYPWTVLSMTQNHVR